MGKNKGETINKHPDFNPDYFATEHVVKYTPLVFPREGAITFICFGMDKIYLRSPAYRIQAQRSVWMGEKGKLGLVIGPVEKRINDLGDKKVEMWRFSDGCVEQWTKPGALHIGKRHLIKIGVITSPARFAGTTRVELDGECCLQWVVENK